MNNNVYIRSNRSIMTLSLTRIIFIIPMIIYGFYKNGVYLYQNSYITLFDMFRPLIFIIGGGLIGFLVNIIYEKIIKKNKSNILNISFSSFHIEYGILLGCVTSINTNLLIFFGVTFSVLFISKFLNNRVNTMALAFIIIFLIGNLLGDYQFANAYETSKNFSLTFMDYLIGRGPGGIAGTHILLLILALFGLYITNNNKTTISLVAVLSYIILAGVYCFFAHQNFLELLFMNNYLFILSFISTDSVTSCYTSRGKMVFGLAISILTFALSFIIPIVAPFVAILVISLFNNLIDRKVN